MIEGKDIYMIACVHLLQENLEQADWERAIPWIQEHYNNLAEKLNTQFIAPMITDLGKLKADFHQLKTIDRQIADEQDREIASLKSLVKDFVTSLEDPGLLAENGADSSWSKVWVTLDRAQQLIGGEK